MEKNWDHRSYPSSDRVKVINKKSNFNLFTFLITEYSKVNALEVYVKMHVDPSLTW